MNVICIAGRLGQDPELKTTQGGTELLKFSVAVNERKKVQGEWQDATTWFNCVTFGKRATGLNKVLSKGTAVSVTGRLEIRDYEKQDGSKGRAVEVICNDVTLQGSRERHGYPSGGGGAPPADDYGSDFSDEDIPF